MADHAHIVAELNSPNRCFQPLPTPDAVTLAELNSVWQWRGDNGLPFFENPNHRWRRYVPPSFSDKVRHHEWGTTFIGGMEGDEEEFDVEYGGGNTKRDGLHKILLADFKKISIQNTCHGFTVTKNDDNLDENPANLQEPLRVTYEGEGGSRKNIADTIDEITLNATRGFMGPGSFRCRHPKCIVSGPLMTQSPVVTWGALPNQTITLTKRFTCKCSNITYLLHCDACLQQGRWTTYVGESDRTQSTRIRNFHSRINQHTLEYSNKNLHKKYKTFSDEEMAAICLGITSFGDEDPDNIFRDPYNHFNFTHTLADRRYTILDGGYQTMGGRKVHESILIHQFGDCVYNAVNRSGGLNHDY